MKIQAGRTFVLFSRYNHKRSRKFRGLFLAKKTIDTEDLPQLPLTHLERYLREEGYIQDVEFHEFTYREDQLTAA